MAYMPPPELTSSPLFLCHTFTSDTCKGNTAGVLFIPTATYCAEWSCLPNLEAICGRGMPGEGEDGRSPEECEAAKGKYARDRHVRMGQAFQTLASELNQSTLAVLYRLPATQLRDIQEKIRNTVNEYEEEYKNERRASQNADAITRRLSSELLHSLDTLSSSMARVKENAHHVPGSVPAPQCPLDTCSMSMSSFGASFIMDGRNELSDVFHSGAVKRRNLQWFGLRWFTPTRELLLSGHATLAASHAIFETSRLYAFRTSGCVWDTVPVELLVPKETDILCFVTDAGVITVQRVMDVELTYQTHRGCTTAEESYEMHFPIMEAHSIKSHVQDGWIASLATALGLLGGADSVVDVAVHPESGCYVVMVTTSDDVRNCQPHDDLLKAEFTSATFTAIQSTYPMDFTSPVGIAVVAAAESRNGNLPGGTMIFSRFFIPWAGVSEDPATGWAHTVIVPYWLRHHRGNYAVGDRVECRQLSQRGGSLTCIIIGKQADRIAVIGAARTFLRGLCSHSAARGQSKCS